MAWAVVTAAWLGVLTSISPCPLATNIAAVSFIGRKVGSPRGVLASGLLYALGRMVAYLALASVAVAGATSIPGVSHFLQAHMHKVLGPVLIVAGMFLLDLVAVDLGGGAISAWGQRVAEKGGVLSPLLLGLLFALALCPVSAALFFGSLVPLAVTHGSVVVLPAAFGAGTALPVVGFAAVIAFSAQSLGRVFNQVTAVEKWARRLTGAVFVVLGVYTCLKYIFEVL